MRPVITPGEAARLDDAAGEPIEVLMERAGLAVALAAVGMGSGYGSRVIVLAGPGNNGGDGYVAARFLKQRGVDVEIRALDFPKGEHSAARKAGAAAAHAGVRIRRLRDAEPADLIVDALFGSGFHGHLPERLDPWIEHPAPLLAVDLPSGLDGFDGSVEGSVFTADTTVTFEAARTGHYVGRGPEVSGEIVVAPIGLPPVRPAYLFADLEDAPVPARRRSDHKWSAGSVVVVGGSEGLAGAAVMAAEAALRFGAGAVRLIVPGGVRVEAASGHPGVMITGIGTSASFSESDVDVILDEAARFDAMVLGPGLGPVTDDLVDVLLDRWGRPLVLDADGINGTGLEVLAARAAPTVITPHAGEFAHLTGIEPDPAAAFALAEDLEAVVVLKGSPTFVGGRGRWAVDSGGPELATIGTGDVLAGMVGALIARGLDPETAARSAAYRHGRAGNELAAVTSVTAVGLLDVIGRWAT